MTVDNNTVDKDSILRKKHKLITKEKIDYFVRLIENKTKSNKIKKVLDISKSTYKRIRAKQRNDV